MPIDPDRATFVSHEYRYETATDSAVKAVYDDAEELELETNLSAASAATLAALYLADLKTPAQAFQVTLQGTIMSLADFDGGVPRFTLTSDNYKTDSRTFKTAGVQIDWLKGTTIVRVRG